MEVKKDSKDDIAVFLGKQKEKDWQKQCKLPKHTQRKITLEKVNTLTKK